MSTLEIKFLKVAIFASLVQFFGRCDDNDPGYGEEWIYYYDDKNIRHVMNFSAIPRSTEGMSLGNVYFNLYTRNNMNNPELLTLPRNNSFIDSCYFNKSNYITFITHGWLSSDQVSWLQRMKDSLLREDNLNVITVDWSEISDNIFYPWPALSTRYVGKRIAKLVKAIQLTYDVGAERVHLIGHSLGAHVVSHAGTFSNTTVSRITGLDPARPLFEFPRMPDDFCLNKNDAEFVDIIHTGGGITGYIKSLGHADFYPNGGTPIQPGCEKCSLCGCSHGRAIEFFDESISYSAENGFIAYMCNSWDEFENGNCKGSSTSMGYRTPRTSRGNYYLKTNNESKYAKLD